jgi:amidohydrolase
MTGRRSEMVSSRSLLLQQAVDLLPELTSLRRALHHHPELPFEERASSAATEKLLARLVPGLTFVPVADTGLIAHREGVEPTVLLRACLDALPIDDPKGVSYASRVEGVCHACGHDAQVAEVVGALAILAGNDSAATIGALFQPAEESDLGALAVLGDPTFQALGGPQVFIGIHGHPGLDAGCFSVQPGPVMACITTLRCEVMGRAGHGAEPHHGPDAVTAAASLVVDWQVALARRIDARSPAVLSIGRIVGGTASNVIPETVAIDGTLRYLDPTLREPLTTVLVGTARAIEAQFGVRVDLQLTEAVPSLVNDGALTALISEAASEIVGPERMTRVSESLGGDDFAQYAQQFPAVYIFCGERQPGRPPYGWHDPSYDIDEQAIAYGAAVLAASALAAASAAPTVRGDVHA